jgi:pimeloyl-ACP methyl ester carboxylesterase
VRSHDYSLGDALRTLRGVTATQGVLLHEINEINLNASVPRLDVPFVMVQGRLDMVAPGGAARGYFDSLVAPKKEFVWFENSAHTPQIDEPTRFRSLMIQIREAHMPSVDAHSTIAMSADISNSYTPLITVKSVQSENGGPR